MMDKVYFIRGHCCVLQSRCLPHHQFRSQYFTDHVIPVCNSLPQDAVSSLNITVFRFRLCAVDLRSLCTPFHRQFVSAQMLAITCLACLLFVSVYFYSIQFNSIQFNSTYSGIHLMMKRSSGDRRYYTFAF